ncbi:MAG: hypothetical protein RBG13Loki_3045 [Promethearchaeota archaeon CR_4]|nr:MAG: hypothetical protein RBG13Loki_3045 [Candidatus Lokiarchaeota archaeon CR_4]
MRATNYNYRLFKNSPHVFSTNYLVNHPGDWWKMPTKNKFHSSKKKSRYNSVQNVKPTLSPANCRGVSILVFGVRLPVKEGQAPKNTVGNEGEEVNQKFIGL